MNKTILLVILAILGILFIGGVLLYVIVDDTSFSHPCENISGCAKYKCLAETVSVITYSISYKLDYQNCLLEEKNEK